MEDNNLVGRRVISTAGRDASRPFIVTKVLNDKYVLISDGKLRTTEKPKKKKIKHLKISDVIDYNIRALLLDNKAFSDSMIRSFLQLNDGDKEV